MKAHRWDALKRSRLSAKKIDAIERKAKKEVLLLTLRELREVSGKTQTEVSKIAKMTQGELSRAERREDHLLSTLRRYIEALGGELEIEAVFGDRRIRLRGV
jgi:DNA-binding transcriptional regulator YdaS (Cro superfamily)